MDLRELVKGNVYILCLAVQPG